LSVESPGVEREAAPRRGTRQSGSITIVTAAVLALAVVITMGAADVGKALVARAHARQAADAAALAAAQEQALPSGRTPAEVADEYASRNGADLTGCACAVGAAEAVVQVAVETGPFLLLPGSRSATASARAVVGADG
jgi:secretion/DNA translocation related TadE-like protein